MSSKTSVRKWGLTLPVLMIAGMAWAQGYPNISHKIEITSPAMDKIRFSDLMKMDPKSSGGSSRIMMRMTISNSGNQDVIINGGDIGFNVKYNGTPLGIEMINGNKVEVKKQSSVVLTNINAMKADGIFGFKKSDGGNISPDVVISALLGPGKTTADVNPMAPIPAGEYTFEFAIAGIGLETASMILSNPSGYVSIVGPGTTFLEEEPGEIYDTKPAISWSGDAPEFELRVVMVDRLVDKSMGDLLSKPAQYSEVTKNKFKRYPNSDLQAGKTYAVLVSSRVNSLGSLSAEEVWATPVWFTIPVAKTASEIAGNQLIEKLKAIFGDQYSEIFEQIKTGKIKGQITIDGKTVTYQELAAILQKLQTGEANLENLDVN